jgi:hypothetical protein
VHVFVEDCAYVFVSILCDWRMKKHKKNFTNKTKYGHQREKGGCYFSDRYNRFPMIQSPSLSFIPYAFPELNKETNHKKVVDNR